MLDISISQLKSCNIKWTSSLENFYRNYAVTSIIHERACTLKKIEDYSAFLLNAFNRYPMRNIVITYMDAWSDSFITHESVFQQQALKTGVLTHVVAPQ